MEEPKPIEIFYQCRTVIVVNGKNETVTATRTKGCDTLKEAQKFLEDAFENLERVSIIGIACDNPNHTVMLSSVIDHMEKKYGKK